MQRATIILGAVVVVGCAGSEATSPGTEQELQLAVVSGNAQEAPGGSTLPAPLVVRITDAAGRPYSFAPGVVVNWVVVAGGGSTYVGATQTDWRGESRNWWTIGQNGAQSLEVRAVHPTTGERLVYGTFTARAAMRSRIAFMSDRSGTNEIYSVSSDGSDLARLTQDLNDDLAPAWSPSGSKIAWYSTRSGNTDIYVMNADGTEQTRLTTSPDADAHPAWSPNGFTIAFQCGGEVCVMNADGSGLRNLTNNTTWDGDPSWSPDGGRIVFDSWRDGEYALWIMDADGANSRKLVGCKRHCAPAWSPDGRRIAFTSDRGGNDDIYLIAVDGSELVRLTNDPASDDAASWSPDGARIVFSSNRAGGVFQAYTMNATGADIIRLLESSGNDFAASWR